MEVHARHTHHPIPRRGKFSLALSRYLFLPPRTLSLALSVSFFSLSFSLVIFFSKLVLPLTFSFPLNFSHTDTKTITSPSSYPFFLHSHSLPRYSEHITHTQSHAHAHARSHAHGHTDPLGHAPSQVFLFFLLTVAAAAAGPGPCTLFPQLLCFGTKTHTVKKKNPILLSKSSETGLNRFLETLTKKKSVRLRFFKACLIMTVDNFLV